MRRWTRPRPKQQWVSRSVGTGTTAAQHHVAQHELWKQNDGRRASDDAVSYYFELQLLSHLWRPCERRPHQHDLQYARPEPQSQRDTTEHDGGHHQRYAQDHHAGAMWPTGKKRPTIFSYARILGVEGVGFPRHAKAARELAQRAAAAVTAVAANVSLGKHIGTNEDAKPYGTTVHDAADDNARASTDANDAAVADDGAATADDGTNSIIVPNGTAAAIGRAANTAVRQATALCWIWNGITIGEELLTVRGG